MNVPCQICRSIHGPFSGPEGSIRSCWKPAVMLVLDSLDQKLWVVADPYAEKKSPWKSWLLLLLIALLAVIAWKNGLLKFR